MRPELELELYAWVGDDELAGGGIGLKQGIVPAGCIPLVAIRRDKVEGLKPQMEAQARRSGKKIRLVRFVAVETVNETEAGS